MNGLKPNESCGLHVNVSLKGQSNNIVYFNPVIFYELFNENKYKLETRFSGDKSISGNEIENYEIKY
jgi:hypothetical protein